MYVYITWCSVTICTHRATLECVEVLWNLLEHGSQLQVRYYGQSSTAINAVCLSQVAEQLNSLDCIQPLHHVVVDLVASSAHVNSKQLRNDLLTLCSLISNLCPDAPFVVSSLSSTHYLTLCHHLPPFLLTHLSSL